MLLNLLGYLTIYCLMISGVIAGELTFIKTLKEVTTEPDVDSVNIAFEFENRTDETITIVDFDAPCACLEARILRAGNSKNVVFKPGEKGAVIGVLDFGSFSGTIDKIIKVRTSNGAVKETSTELTCRVTIPKLIKTSEENLEWQVGEKLNKRKFHIVVSEESDVPIKIVRHSLGFSSKSAFDYELKTLEDGKVYEVTVVPKNTDKPSMGVVKFYTDSKLDRYKMVQVFLLVDHPEK